MKIIASLLILAIHLPLNAQEKIKIGVSSALTGNASTYGIDLKNSIIFANEKLTNNSYQLEFEDDKCSGKDAVTVAHRLLNFQNIKYLAGFACSGAVLSTAKIYEKANTLTMVMVASASDIAKAGDFIFRTWPSDEKAAEKLYKYVSTKHKVFGILSEQTDYAQGFLNSFSRHNDSSKFLLVNENFNTETLDLRSILLKLKSKNIDGLFINSQSESTLLTGLKQAKEIGISAPLYSAYFGGSPSFLNNAKEMANGMIVVDPPSVTDVSNPEGLALYSDFKKQFGEMKSVELIFITAFEGIRAIHEAIKSGQEPRKYLYSAKFHGLFGDWWFDQNGEIQGLDFVLKIIKDGKVEKL